MELKNNYKVIYEVIDDEKNTRTFYASKDTDINPEHDDIVGKPIKFGTYKVIYEKGKTLVGIKEYGQEPELIVDLSKFIDADYKPEEEPEEKKTVAAETPKTKEAPVKKAAPAVKEEKPAAETK